MKAEKQKNNGFRFAALVFILICTGQFGGKTLPAMAEESVSVNCFVMHGDKYISAGGDVVVEKSAVPYAARNCNKLYYDCKGKCIGCYLVNEERVCFDRNGNKLD